MWVKITAKEKELLEYLLNRHWIEEAIDIEVYRQNGKDWLETLACDGDPAFIRFQWEIESMQAEEKITELDYQSVLDECRHLKNGNYRVWIQGKCPQDASTRADEQYHSREEDNAFIAKI